MGTTSRAAPPLLGSEIRVRPRSLAFLRPLVLAVTLPVGLFIAVKLCWSSAGNELIRASDWWWVGIVLGLMIWPFCLLAEPAQTATHRATYLPGLDGWRAIAIGLVLVDHTVRGFCARRKLPLPIALIHGQHGVNLFFAISGLLITWKLLEEREQTGDISLTGFYRRRIYRILPAAFVYLCAVALLSLAGAIVLRRVDLASTVLYFRNFVTTGGQVTLATGHFWSLSIEEQFYVFLPALLLLLGTRRFQSLAVVLISTCAAWRWFFFQFFAPENAPITLRFRTDVRIDGLLCGCLMAIVLADSRARRVMGKFFTIPVLIGLSTALLLIIHRKGEYTSLPESLVLPLLLAGTLLRPDKLPCRILEWAPLRWIGRISYSLYLWQQLFLIVHSDNWLLSRLQYFPANLAATFLCAVLSYYVVERPMLRRAHGKSRPAATPSRALAAETA